MKPIYELHYEVNNPLDFLSTVHAVMYLKDNACIHFNAAHQDLIMTFYFPLEWGLVSTDFGYTLEVWIKQNLPGSEFYFHPGIKHPFIVAQRMPNRKIPSIGTKVRVNIGHVSYPGKIVIVSPNGHYVEVAINPFNRGFACSPTVGFFLRGMGRYERLGDNPWVLE